MLPVPEGRGGRFIKAADKQDALGGGAEMNDNICADCTATKCVFDSFNATSCTAFRLKPFPIDKNTLTRWLYAGDENDG
jgi:hypothetical protein